MEMKALKKLRKLSNIIFLFILIFLIYNSAATAKYFQGELKNFIQTEHKITVPVFEPQQRIKIKAVEDTYITAVGKEDLKLEKGEEYYISQFYFDLAKTAGSKIKAAEKNQVSESELESAKSFWGIQVLASSTKEKAQEFKNELKRQFEVELMIIEEDSLFKVIAGNYEQKNEAEILKRQLETAGYNNLWSREIEKRSYKAENNSRTAETEQKERVEENNSINAESDKSEIGLIFFDKKGEKLREAYVLKISGTFEVEEKIFSGEYSFGPIANSVLFSYKTDLEDLTAYLLQNYFNPGAPQEALKAQAVIFRSSLLYQLEVQGARLESLSELDFSSVSPIFKEAVSATKNEVLINGDSFYYNDDFSLRKIKKPKAGIIPLAQAKYSYQEIINYYYDRSQIANLNDLLDTEEKFRARIERGLYFKEIRQRSWQGPRVLTVIDYDLSLNNLTLKPVLARGIVPGREDLSELIKEHSALAGVNGGYFHYSGRPLGLLYINGDLVSEPLYNRSALLIDQNGEISFAQVDWKAEFKSDAVSDKIKIDGVNREVKDGEIVLFNHFYGYQLPALENKYYDIVVRDDKILGVESEKGVQTPIPPDGYVLRVSALRNEIRNLIPQLKGSNASLNYNLTPDFQKKNILHAVGAGPRLLKNSEVFINGQEENFQNDIIKGRAPRTAIGLTKDNHLLFLTIDGRQSDYSIGMTLSELARTLKSLGAVDAVNLDGGGSARMVIRGFTMSNPSEERLISNGVLVKEENK